MLKPQVAKMRKIALCILPMPLTLLISAGIVVSSSAAAFNGSVSNNGSKWQAGTVSIGDSSKDSIGGHTLFDDHRISPGYSSSRCVTVNSRSDIDTRARMYGINISDNTLSDAMTIKIEKGHIDAKDAAGTSCGSFRNGEVIFDNSLAAFGREAKDYARGLSLSRNGDHLSPGGNVTYRITMGLSANAGNIVANEEAEATFKWEAQG